MQKRFLNLLIVSSTLFMIAIILGAFGAHVLRHKLSSEMLNAYTVGVRYQFYISSLLYIIAFIYKSTRCRGIFIAWLIALVSDILFSGSLYVLSLSGIKIIGFITPIGGVGLIISLLVLIIVLIKNK